MKRTTITEQLKNDLRNNLHSGSDYKSDPVKVIEGITSFDDAIQRPVIAFMITSDEIMDEDLGAVEGRERILNILLYGFDDVTSDQYSNIYDLIDDIETFLMNGSHWAYADQTLLGSVSLFVSEQNFNRAYFTLEIQVYYTQTL